MNMDKFYNQLGMMQLSDSFFPSGLFATSHGLEIFIQDKKIKNADDLFDLIKVFIEQQIGPCDSVALINTFDFILENNFEKIVETDQICFSMKLVKEIRETATRSGIQVLKCVQSFQNHEILNNYLNSIQTGLCTGVFPVSFAIACNAIGVQKSQSVLMMLYGFSVSMVGAALRMGLIDHFEGQKILHTLKPIITNTICENINKKPSSMWQFAPEIDIIQMSHEKMHSKMFVT